MMAIDYQLAHVPFAGGLAQHVAPALIPPGKLFTAQNAIIRKQGSVEMRPGTEAMTRDVLSNATALDDTRRIIANGDETVVLSDRRLYSYASKPDGWRDVDDCYEAVVADRIRGERGRGVLGSTAGLVCDAVYCNGYYVIAWTDGDTITANVRLIDATTGTRLPLHQWTMGNWRIRLCVIGVKVYATYETVGGGSLETLVFDTANPEDALAAAVVTGTELEGHVWEACTNGTSLILAYNHVLGATHDIRVNKVNAALTIVVNGDGGSTSQGVFGLASQADGKTYVAYPPAAGGINCMILTTGTMAVDTDVVVSATETPFRMAVAIDDTGTGSRSALIVWDRQSALLTSYIMCQAITSAGVLGGTGTTHHVGLLAKPFYKSGTPYFAAYYSIIGSNSGRLQYLLEPVIRVIPPGLGGQPDSPARVVARIAWWRGGDPEKTYRWHSNMTTVGTGEYCFATPMKSETVDGLVEGFDVYKLAFDEAEHQGLSTSAIQGQPLFGGGVPALYDGLRCYEYGFHHPPEIVSVTAGGAGSHSAGTYSYKVVYEWVDARGTKHMSEPSAPVTVTHAAGSLSATVVVHNLALSEKCDDDMLTAPVGIVVYRTVANGEVYYFEQWVENVRTAPTASITSTLSDAAIAVNEKIYTDGDVLSNVTPPAMLHVIQHNNRLWGISADDPEFVWASKINRMAGVMPGFAFDFIMRTDTDGPCVALGSLDNKLVIFKERAIYALVGEGPNDQGLSNDLGNPARISVGVGCIDCRSVASVQAGIVFRAHDGIYLLGRDLSVQHISAGVEDLLPSDYVVTSACQVDTDSLILFTVDPPVGSTVDPFVLAYHVAINEWTEWRIPDPGGIASPSSMRTRGAAVCLHNGSKVWHMLHDDGYVVRLQYVDRYDSDGSLMGFRVSSPWISFAGVQGYERIQFVGIQGTYDSPHSLRVVLYHDHDESGNSTVYTMTKAQIEAARSHAVEAIELHVVYQDCRAIRVDVTVQPEVDALLDGGNLAGVRLESLAFEVGGERGHFRLPAVARW